MTIAQKTKPSKSPVAKKSKKSTKPARAVDVPIPLRPSALATEPVVALPAPDPFAAFLADAVQALDMAPIAKDDPAMVLEEIRMVARFRVRYREALHVPSGTLVDEIPVTNAERAAERAIARSTGVLGFSRLSGMSIGDLLAMAFNNGDDGEPIGSGLLATVGDMLDILHGAMERADGGLPDPYLAHLISRLQNLARYGAEVGRRLDPPREESTTAAYANARKAVA